MEPGTVYIDAAVGSREFEPLLSARGVPCQVVPKLPADFALLGCGKGGTEWKIGVERKTLGDLGSSLIRDRLFGTQLPRMLAEYERIWLVVEGIFREGADDAIEVQGWDPVTRRRGWVPSRVSLTWSQLQRWMMTYDEMGGGKVRRWRTSTESETAAWLSSLRRWWMKPYHTHNGHMAVDQNPDYKTRGAASFLLYRPTLLQEMAYPLPGIGVVSMKKVGRFFESIEDMVNASEAEWCEAGLGKKAAKTVWAEIRRKYRTRPRLR